MSLFNKKQKSGGLADQIRCDEPSYLIWKWHPYGSQLGNSNRENAIRWGSSLRVKDGEVAVFVYDQGTIQQDFIEGPFDEILETENLPVLASIIGLAYQGGTPFQAEVYFINLAKIIQIPFAVPYFDLYDPRFLDFSVPVAVRGKLTFNIRNYREFIKLHRLSNFDLNMFQDQIREVLSRYVKSVIVNLPSEKNISAIQIERQISAVNDMVEALVKRRLEPDFGINVTAIDIDAIDVDKTSSNYKQLKSITQDLTAAQAKAQADVSIKDMYVNQQIHAKNKEETFRIQREEAQYAQRKQTQSSNFAAYQMEQQASVGVAGAEALGKMGSHNDTLISGNTGINPTGMMTEIAMGSVIGQNMATTMNKMMQGINNSQTLASPPPIPSLKYYVDISGKATGPFDFNTLSQLCTSGLLTPENYVWKQGMTEWARAKDVQEVCSLFRLSENSGHENTPPIPPSH